MTKFLKDSSLTIVLMLLFAVSIAGQALAGWKVENQDLARHGKDVIGLISYLGGPAFISSVFENWESEFLQMSAYVVLTAMLVQRGSSESRDPDAPDRDEGVSASWLYAHSLGLTLFALFIASFVLHWVNSAKAAAQEALEFGEPAHGVIAYFGDPQLWFESFQNWQSEFLSTAVLVMLSIFLRQRNSPESKPLDAANGKTGD